MRAFNQVSLSDLTVCAQTHTVEHDDKGINPLCATQRCFSNPLELKHSSGNCVTMQFCSTQNNTDSNYCLFKSLNFHFSEWHMENNLQSSSETWGIKHVRFLYFPRRASPKMSFTYQETNPSPRCLRIRIHYNVIHYCLVIIAKLKCHTSSL